MKALSKTKKATIIFTVLFCILLFTTQVNALSLEQTISRRKSVRSYNSDEVTNKQLLDVLWAAYGESGQRKNVPQIGDAYSLIVYTVNQTGCYRYVPETNSLTAHNLDINKQDISSYNSGWPSDAKEVLVIVWDSSIADNHYFACAEAGCLAQNVHLAAASVDLGTCVVGSIDAEGLSSTLQLPSTQTPLLVMPLGFFTDSYGAATPKYSTMTGNLPKVQISNVSFEDAIKNMQFTQEWPSETLSLQQLSQLLWAAYGYSSTGHRTTPSAYGIYPLVIYVANSTGVYKYEPETHLVSQILQTDKRFDVANAFSGQVWAASAPTMIVIGYDSSYNNGNTGDGGVLSHLFMEVNTGCVVQQIFLEASAQNLKTNILSEGAEEWNGATAQELRSILGLSNSIIPLYAIPVGKSETDLVPPSIGVPSQEPNVDAVEPNQSVKVSVQVTDELGVKEVVLSFSIDESETWTNTTMTSSSTNTYIGEISGFEENTHVKYKISAYDNANNYSVQDNAGEYYVYTVFLEFSNLVLVFFVASILLVVLKAKRNKHKST